MEATTKIIAKPHLPKEFTKTNNWETLFMVSYMLLMLLIPSVVIYQLVYVSTLPWLWKFILSAPLFLLSGQAYHLMGWLGHDGFHFALHRNRMVSAIIGMVTSSMTLAFLQVGMAMDHWSHHRFANTEKDPDLTLLNTYKNFWSRMLFQRARANRHYFMRTINYALNRPLPVELTHVRLPFSKQVFRWLAVLNLTLVAFWLSVYVYINSLFPGMFWIMVVVPMIVGAWLSGLRSFTEHSETTIGEFQDTRSRTHLLLTLLEAGGNYHLEHHLYPTVPQWRLPRLHRWLAAQGYFTNLKDPGLIDPTLSVYKYARRRYTYGELMPSGR